MPTTIFAYTGTGNSLWVARTLAAKLPEAEVASIVRATEGAPRCEAESIGIVFPVHMWGVPPRVVDFARRLEVPEGAYLFAVAVNAGQVSRTLIQLGELFEKRGRRLSAGYSVVLPSNYIPWGGPGPKRAQEQRFEAAGKRLEEIAARLARRDREQLESGPLWQRVAFTAAYKASAPHLARMDRSFWTDDRCNGCGTCTRVCPSQNVVLEGGKPRWQGGCEQCFACLQWCPRGALQYGKRTPRFARYHHPEIGLEDVVGLVRRDEKKTEGAA